MDFTKIAFTPPKDSRLGTVRLEWTEQRVAESGELVTDERTLKSTDAPHPDFTEALQRLAPIVAEACFATQEEVDNATEAGIDDAVPALVVRSVTLKETAGPDGEAAQGVTITALRELPWSNAPLVLNTPFAPVEMLPFGAEGRVEALVFEATAYAKGKRAQGGLFDGMREMVNRPDSGIDEVTMIHEGRETVLAERAQA